MILHALFLGLLQGVTEFLPISSSGHLVLVQAVIPGFAAPGLVFDVILHAGTLFAVLFYYWKNLLWLVSGFIGNQNSRSKKEARTWLYAVVIGTIPAGILGLFAQDFIESLFENPLYVSMFLCCTGLILFCGEWLRSLKISTNSDEGNITVSAGLIVGLAQALALVPGISRSGSTMAAGLAMGWSREKAAKFSFFLMIPAVAGAVLLKARDVPEMVVSGQLEPFSLLIGFLASFLAGYLSISFLIRMLRKHSFIPYAVYCVCAGSISFLVQIL